MFVQRATNVAATVAASVSEQLRRTAVV